MKSKCFILLLGGVILGGCINLNLDLSDILSDVYFLPGVSVHPLYTDETTVFDERLIGSWEGGNEDMFAFAKIEDVNAYNLTIGNGDEKGKFIVHLVKLDDMLFLDLFPDRLGPNSISGAEIQNLLLVPVHLFAKVEEIEPELKLRIMTPDANSLASLKHEIVGEHGLLITASTQELQDFMKKHANDEGLFSDAQSLGKKLEDVNSIDTNSISANMCQKESAIKE